MPLQPERRPQSRAASAGANARTLDGGRRGGYPLFRLVLLQPATRVRFDGGNSTEQSGLFGLRLLTGGRALVSAKAPAEEFPAHRSTSAPAGKTHVSVQKTHV